MSESQSCFGDFHEMAHIWGSDLGLLIGQQRLINHNGSQQVKTESQRVQNYLQRLTTSQKRYTTSHN